MNAPLPMRERPALPGTQRGMSLIDVLVGMVIGLIGMIVVFQSFNAFESQKRTTMTATDAQESGLMALTTIEREMRLVGYGMYYGNRAICASMRQWANSGIETIPNVLPIAITNGASNASDAVTLTYSTSAFGATPAMIQVNFDGSTPEVIVDNAVGNSAFRMGDHILIGTPSVPTRPCVRLQVSSVISDPTAPQRVSLRLESGTTAPANPPAAQLRTLVPSGGYSNNPEPSLASVVTNMAAMRRVTYGVVLDSSYNGRLQAQDVTGGTAAVDVADGIVNMQAQYGISTTAQTMEVSSWVDATGTWAAPGEADAGRIKAVRIAVVARSQLLEKEAVTGVGVTCSNTSGDNANGPCAWRDTTANPAPVIDLSANTNWQRYRYRVYETIVPLRNVMWQTFQ